MDTGTQAHWTECSGSSSSSGSGGLNISSSSTDSDASHLFHPVARSSTATEPVVPRDIARSHDEKPVQPQLTNFQKMKVGDRNRYSIQRDAVYCFSCRLFPLSFSDTTFTTEGCNKWKKIGEKL